MSTEDRNIRGDGGNIEEPESEIVNSEAEPNVSVYSGFDPFVGAGDSLGHWSLLIDTRNGKDRTSPDQFSVQEIEEATHYSIQAKVVRAEALAVGENARAIVTASQHEEVALGASANAIQRLSLDVVQQQSILKDVEAMTIEKGAAASMFEKIVSTLKAAGYAAGYIAELIEPLKAVAWAFGLPAPF